VDQDASRPDRMSSEVQSPARDRMSRCEVD